MLEVEPKTKQSGCGGVLNALARSVTKAPKLKKNLVLQGKKSDQRKLLFTLEKLVF
jgi:hypothetical protein